MRRVSLTALVIFIVLNLTTSLAIAGMRVNRLTFTVVGSTSGSLALVQASRTAVDTNGDICSKATPCVGLSLNASGILTGISNEIADQAVVQLTVQGIPVSVTCTNKGGSQAPGQNPAAITSTVQQLIASGDVTKRGTAPLNLTATFASQTYPGNTMGCPNANWTATVNSVQFTCATIQVVSGTSTVLEQRYDLDGTCAV